MTEHAGGPQRPSATSPAPGTPVDDRSGDHPNGRAADTADTAAPAGGEPAVPEHPDAGRSGPADLAEPADDVGSDPRPRAAAHQDPAAGPPGDDAGEDWDHGPWAGAPWAAPPPGAGQQAGVAEEQEETPDGALGAAPPPRPDDPAAGSGHETGTAGEPDGAAAPADQAAWPHRAGATGTDGSAAGTFDDATQAAPEPGGAADRATNGSAPPGTTPSGTGAAGGSIPADSAPAGGAAAGPGAAGTSGDASGGTPSRARDGSGRYAAPPERGSGTSQEPDRANGRGPARPPAAPAPGQVPPPDPAGTPGPHPVGDPYHPRHGAHNPFLQQSEAVPHKGMRRLVYRATFGTVNLGPSGQEQSARLRRERVQRTLHGSWRVVVMSIKGGVGKTTTAAMLGRTLAEWRGDRVVALDTNPDMGTLGDRLVGSTDMTVRGLLAHEARHPIQQVGEVNRYTSLAGRLHVLANEQDPAVSEDFTGQEYAQTLDILERFYNVIIADCGTGVLRPWVRDMLALANTLVVVAEPKGDAATRAAGTLDWIEQHGFRDLVARSVAVINYRSPTPKSLDISALDTFFGERCRAVRTIRYDEHLDLGVQIQYDRIQDAPSEAYVSEATKEDYLELAATITDEFS